MKSEVISEKAFADPNSSPRHLPAPPLPPRATFVDVSVQTENSATSSRSFRDGRELIELNIDMGKVFCYFLTFFEHFHSVQFSFRVLDNKIVEQFAFISRTVCIYL